MRRGLVLLADDPHDLGQLLHQVAPVLQPACGVDQQQVGAFLLRATHGVECKAGRIAAMGCGQDRHARTIAPDLQLLHRSGAERVACGDHDLLARRAEL